MPHPRPSPQRLATIRSQLAATAATNPRQRALLAEIDALNQVVFVHGVTTVAPELADPDRWKIEVLIEVLERINAAAEADIGAGGPITGAHHRALTAELAAARQRLEPGHPTEIPLSEEEA